MVNKIVFASKNKGKIREVRQLFAGINIEIVDVPDNFNAIEDGDTFLDNAIIKAVEASKLTNMFALADDSGLIVDALDGEPGVHSSRYAEGDRAKINKLLGALEGVSEDQRTARFVCSMAFVSPEGELMHSTSGVCEGRIIFEPRGTDGFGFDPVFLLPEINLTMAEISIEQKNSLSHRAKAFSQMLKWFKNYNVTSI